MDDPALTDEQLAMAFRHLARPGWPATAAEALQHPVYGPCVRGLARNFSRRGRPQPCGGRPAHSLPRPPAPPTDPPRPTKSTAPNTALGAWPAVTGKRRTATTAGHFDPRKAAANDIDETAA